MKTMYSYLSILIVFFGVTSAQASEVKITESCPSAQDIMRINGWDIYNTLDFVEGQLSIEIISKHPSDIMGDYPICRVNYYLLNSVIKDSKGSVHSGMYNKKWKLWRNGDGFFSLY